MRCKSCDSPKTLYRERLGDFYCSKCADVINQTIREDDSTNIHQSDLAYFGYDLSWTGEKSD